MFSQCCTIRKEDLSLHSSRSNGLVGGKWKAVILYHLKDKAKRFSELHKDLHSVTEATLNIQLKQLESDSLISKTVISKKPPLVVTYQLTDFGKTFLPTLESTTQWGNRVIQERGSFINKKETI